MVKGRAAYAVVACILIVVCVSSIGSYLYGCHVTCVRMTHSYYSAHGDNDLMDQFRFPFPFLKKKAEKEGWRRRAEVHAGIAGYTRFHTGSGPDGGIIDTYVFGLPPFGESVIYITYDVEGQLLGIDEQGPSISLRAK